MARVWKTRTGHGYGYSRVRVQVYHQVPEYPGTPDPKLGALSTYFDYNLHSKSFKTMNAKETAVLLEAVGHKPSLEMAQMEQ